MVKFKQKSLPVYENLDNRYSIDDCLPQRKAIESGKIGFWALTNGHYPGRRINPSLLSGVSSLGYFDVTSEQDWGIPYHRNEGIEICFQRTGTGNLTVDGSSHQLGPKSLTITRPWQLHSLGSPRLQPGCLYWLILDVGVRRPNQTWQLPDWCILSPEDQRNLIRMLRGNEAPVWNASSEVASIFGRLGKLISCTKPSEQISRIRIELNALLAGLLDMLYAENPTVDEDLMSRRRTVEQFFHELNEDTALLAYPWTLERMAKSCGMGRTAFTGYCHEIMNKSPLQVLNIVRLRYAADLLRTQPHKRIIDVALEVGFSSSQYFSQKFRQQFKTTPRDYRQRP